MARLMRLDSFQQFAAIKPSDDLGLIQGPKLVDNCATITLKFSLASGKTGHVVLGGRYTPPFAASQTTANAIHTGLSTGAQWTALAAFLSTATSFTGVDIRNIHIKDQPIISSNTTAAPGTSAGTDMPNELAQVISLVTGLTGPRYRGRAYIPGWATNALGTGNVAASAAITALNNWGSSIRTVFAASQFTWVLALPARNAYDSPLTGTHFDARPKESPAVTANGVNGTWDTQRRRGKK